jgi:heme-degrading monooxygenase HmoA
VRTGAKRSADTSIAHLGTEGRLSDAPIGNLRIRSSGGCLRVAEPASPGLETVIVTGWAAPAQSPAYSGPAITDWRAAYVQKTGIEGYQRTPGNRGAWLLWRVEGDHAEFITVSFWESRAAIEAFAGQDIEKAAFYPDDEQFLIERDLTVHHYEVADTE